MLGGYLAPDPFPCGASSDILGSSVMTKRIRITIRMTVMEEEEQQQKD